MTDNKKPDIRKQQPYFLILAGLLLALMIYQSFFATKNARVSFSYQLEHLVNLDLIQPEFSKKTATSSNLSTFAGKFRENRSEISKQRYHYLELIEEKNTATLEKTGLEQEIEQNKGKVISAANLFLNSTGLKVPSSGYQVVSEFYDTPEYQNHITVRGPKVVSKESFYALKDAYDSDLAGNDEAQVDAYVHKLSNVVATLRSPMLGVGSEPLKQILRETDANLQGALAAGTLIQEKKTVLQKSFSSIQSVIDKLDMIEDHVRLLKLRSVRDYIKQLEQFSDQTKKIDEIDQKLDRAYLAVQNYVWFFNNEELTSRELEKQPIEAFHQWFIAAKEEYSRFEDNKGLSFKAPDQPVNKVLEKTFKSEELPANYVGYFLSLAPLLLILFLLYIAFSRQVKNMGGNPMDFNRSPARLYPKGSNDITFKDVAGIDDALEELEEIVEFLKNPQKFTALGGKIPKGVLCVGPPGTGKTLIAKAVAGEADCPFFSISGSDFVEMFVGVGASRIRKMFEDAKRNAPCIIFIDEIDAVGRHRGVGMGGGHDEREQTLNQLLVEMDGFDTTEGIIIIAATNRPDVLDKALLRPGRFDRQVIISLPDIKGRFEILKVHAKKIKLDESVDLMTIAKGTPGASGADLANMLNEAALLAARRNRSAVTMEELLEAKDKVVYGKERRNLELDLQERQSTAYHESGHALVGALVEHVDPIDKVTIIPRGFSLGSTMVLPKKNRVTYWKKELLDQLAFLMGGRAAEEIFVGDVSNGAKNDIERATQLARSMVCEWGMSDKLGTMTYDDRSENSQYLGGNNFREKLYSEQTAEEIDHEVRLLLDSAYEQAKQLVTQNKKTIELMAEMLMEFETLDADDIQKIITGTWDIEEKRGKLKTALEKSKKVPPPLPQEALADDSGEVPPSQRASVRVEG